MKINVLHNFYFHRKRARKTRRAIAIYVFSLEIEINWKKINAKGIFACTIIIRNELWAGVDNLLFHSNLST